MAVDDVPEELDGARLLMVATVGPAQRPTGHALHAVVMYPAVAHLALATYDGGDGVYLVHCDHTWRVLNDCLGAAADEAIAQARFEFTNLTFHPV